MRFPIFITVALVISSVVLAAVIASFQRETTGSEDKYRRHSSGDIDLLYKYPTSPVAFGGADGFGDDYNDNIDITANLFPTVNLGLDSDNDGLDDLTEIALGTDIFNPDTDHDGSSDNAEIIIGTDPLDPSSGGTKLIDTTYTPGGDGDPDDGDPDGDDNPPIKPPPTLTAKLDKKVKNITQNTQTWQEYIMANNGDNLAFKITFSLTNNTDITAVVTMSDSLGTGLVYTHGSGKLSVGSAPPINLPDIWLLGYQLPIESNIVDPIVIEFSFNATVQTSGVSNVTTLNRALLQTSNEIQTDTAYVGVN